MANFFFFGFVLIFTVTVVLSNETQTFNPKLEWICETFFISLTVKTDLPFHGIIHSSGHRSDCAIAGNGTILTNMIIPFGGKNDKCGVKFNTISETYWVEITVHYHKILETEYDRIFNVTCDKNIIVSEPEFNFLLIFIEFL
uniref:ZP domain-containing protein n=1 Tax=Panagrolaimus superbus TaxID=310955 RepID=A0A914XWN7_9BILA